MPNTNQNQNNQTPIQTSKQNQTSKRQRPKKPK